MKKPDPFRPLLRRSSFRSLLPVVVAVLAMVWIVEKSHADVSLVVRHQLGSHYLTSVCAREGTLLAVGLGGVTASSLDGGASWTRGTTSQTQHLYSVACGRNQWMAVGEAGSVLSSIDLSTWVPRNSGVTNTLRAITFADDLFVAVGDDVVITSSDGVTWVQRNKTVGAVWNAVAKGSGLFVCVGVGPRALSSADGTNWTLIPLAVTNGTFSALAYASDQFFATLRFRMLHGGLAVDRVQILRTKNGVDWESTFEQDFVNAEDFNGVTFGAGMRVVLGSFNVLIQPDPDPALAGQDFYCSLDGTNWSASAFKTEYNNGIGRLRSIAYAGNGRFVAVGERGTVAVLGEAISGEWWTNPPSLQWFPVSGLSGSNSYAFTRAGEEIYAARLGAYTNLKSAVVNGGLLDFSDLPIMPIEIRSLTARRYTNSDEEVVIGSYGGGVSAWNPRTRQHTPIFSLAPDRVDGLYATGEWVYWDTANYGLYSGIHRHHRQAGEQYIWVRPGSFGHNPPWAPSPIFYDLRGMVVPTALNNRVLYSSRWSTNHGNSFTSGYRVRGSNGWVESVSMTHAVEYGGDVIIGRDHLGRLLVGQLGQVFCLLSPRTLDNNTSLFFDNQSGVLLLVDGSGGVSTMLAKPGETPLRPRLVIDSTRKIYRPRWTIGFRLQRAGDPGGPFTDSTEQAVETSDAIEVSSGAANSEFFRLAK